MPSVWLELKNMSAGNRVTCMSLNNRVYDSDLVTVTILNFNDICFMQKYCMYVQTYTLITLVNKRDNFHYVSKWNDCKLWNYLQCVDICINNSLFLSGCVSVYVFSTYHVTHFEVLWHPFDGKTIVSTLLWANCTKVIGRNWIVRFELNIVWWMTANCFLADVQ